MNEVRRFTTAWIHELSPRQWTLPTGTLISLWADSCYVCSPVATFSSSPTTPGALLFEYLTPTTYASSHPLAFLSEFQIHRKIHGIIGILDCSEYPPASALGPALTGFASSLADLPKTFATKIYAFEPSPQQVEDVRNGLGAVDGLVTIPPTGDVAFFLNTLLADFASEVLWDFSNMVSHTIHRSVSSH